MRVNPKNTWGSPGGKDVQRSDLWVLDMRQVIRGLNFDLNYLSSYTYASSVTMPELSVAADQSRQDSRNYSRPGFDNAPGPVKVVFVHDSNAALGYARMYDLLNQWRNRVRAGRGAVVSGNFAPEIDIDAFANFNVPILFDVTIYMLQGAVPPGEITPGGVDWANFESWDVDQRFFTQEPDFDVSTTYVLKNAWLAGFGVSELSYGQSHGVEITANLQCDDIHVIPTSV